MFLRVMTVLLAIFLFLTSTLAAFFGYGWYRTSAKLAECEAAACKAAVEELAALKAARKQTTKVVKAPAKPTPAAPCEPPKPTSACSREEDPTLRDACERLALR